MLPRLSEVTQTKKLYLDFIDALKGGGFEGELNSDYAGMRYFKN